MSTAQVACTYAMMILHDEGIPITAEKIDTLTKSANVAVESHWTRLFAKLAAKDIGELISNAVGSAPAPVAMAAPETAAAAAAPAPAPAPAVEKKKEEEPEEDSDDDVGPLFDIFE